MKLGYCIVMATLVMAGCRGDETVPPASTTETEANGQPTESIVAPSFEENSTVNLTQIESADLANAKAAALTAAPGSSVYVLYGHNNDIYIAEIGSDNALSNPTKANGETPAYLSSIEPPALAVDSEGRLHVAWMHMEGMLSDFWYARSDGDEEFSEPVQINETPQEIGTMINLAVDESGNTSAAWLQGLNLVLARSVDGGQTFSTAIIDREVCDCCRPQLALMDNQLFIAYRNSDYDDQGKNIRDVHVGWLNNKGEFSTTRVADEHWYLNACPISGPSFSVVGDKLMLTWMDGRNDTSGHMEHTDVWFAVSTDGGTSFSPNVRVTSDDAVYRKLPTLAADDNGKLHIVWTEESTEGAALFYAASIDGGQTFSRPQIIVSGENNTRPDNPMLASADGRLYLVWTASDGTHLGFLAED